MDFAFSLAIGALASAATAASAAVLMRRICEAACMHGVPVPSTVREGLLQLLDGRPSTEVTFWLCLHLEFG